MLQTILDTWNLSMIFTNLFPSKELPSSLTTGSHFFFTCFLWYNTQNWISCLVLCGVLTWQLDTSWRLTTLKSNSQLHNNTLTQTTLKEKGKYLNREGWSQTFVDADMKENLSWPIHIWINRKIPCPLI